MSARSVVVASTVGLALVFALPVRRGLIVHLLSRPVLIAKQGKSVELRRKSAMTVRSASSVISKDKRRVLSAPNIKEQNLLQEALPVNATMGF